MEDHGKEGGDIGIFSKPRGREKSSYGKFQKLFKVNIFRHCLDSLQFLPKEQNFVLDHLSHSVHII